MGQPEVSPHISAVDPGESTALTASVEGAEDCELKYHWYDSGKANVLDGKRMRGALPRLRRQILTQYSAAGSWKDSSRADRDCRLRRHGLCGSESGCGFHQMLTLSPVERVGAISKRSFLEDYRRPRRPVVVEELTASWPARRTWSADYFKRVAGHRKVPVCDGSHPARGRTYPHAPNTHMRFADYLDRLRDGERALRIFFLRVLSTLPELVPDFAYPDLGVRYVEHLSVLFAGGRGARVQMHFDVDFADVLLCHFGGRKRVILFAPDQTPYLYRVPFSFSARFDVAPELPDYETFPALAHARGEIAEVGHGDVLYIPPGYWHYVLYDDVGFSLSLRTLPGTARDVAAALGNIVVIRTVDSVMRKVLGQRWNDRNERLAVERPHRRLGLGTLAAT